MGELKNVDWRTPYDYSNRKGKFFFVSYSHEDETLLREDTEYLIDAGVRIWFDRDLHYGDDWKKRVKKCVSHPDCAGACFYLSDRSVTSEAILWEIKTVLEERERRSFLTFAVNIGGKKVLKFLQDNLKDYALEQQNRFTRPILTHFRRKTISPNARRIPTTIRIYRVLSPNSKTGASAIPTCPTPN